YRLEGEVAALEARKPAPLGEKERRHLLQLGADLELAWSHPAATAAMRKRILRAALYEIVVRIEGSLIEMVLHWQGGDHTALKLIKGEDMAGYREQKPSRRSLTSDPTQQSLMFQ